MAEVELTGTAEVDIELALAVYMVWHLSGIASAELTARLDYEDDDITGMITRY